MHTEHEVIVFVCAEGDAISSYADLHRVEADLDRTFHFDAGSFYTCWKILIFTFILSSASLHRFNFLVSVIIINIFGSTYRTLKFSRKWL